MLFFCDNTHEKSARMNSSISINNTPEFKIQHLDTKSPQGAVVIFMFLDYVYDDDVCVPFSAVVQSKVHPDGQGAQPSAP